MLGCTLDTVQSLRRRGGAAAQQLPAGPLQCTPTKSLGRGNADMAHILNLHVPRTGVLAHGGNG